MSKICAAFALAGVLLFSNLTSAQESLFSRVRVKTVYGQPDGATPRPGGRSQPTTVQTRAELSRLLQEVGIESTDSEQLGVAFERASGSGTWQFEITISEEGDALELAIALRTVPLLQPLTAKTLLALMSANRVHKPAYFAFDPATNRLELLETIANRDLTGGVLLDKVERLMRIAGDTQTIWQASSTPSSETPPPATASPSNPPTTTTPRATSPTKGTPATKAPGRLVGRWTATRSAKEAFAVQFNSDGTFVLVYVFQGKQIRSTGKYTLQDKLLTLTGSGGFRLVGELSEQTDNAFRFLPQKAAADKSMVFKRAT